MKTLLLKTISELKLIYQWLEMPVCVAFSGGKDSVVLLDIVKRSKIPYFARYHVTTVDPPEVVNFIKHNFPEVIFSLPKLSMWKLIIKNRMPPIRTKRFCCRALKEVKYKGLLLTGVRREESFARKNRPNLYLRSKFQVQFKPINDWTDKDVWEHIEKYNLPYCSLYDIEGISRIGCIGCPNSGKKERIYRLNMWPKYKEQYLRTFQRMIEFWKDKKPVTWKTGQEVMDWWLSK